MKSFEAVLINIHKWDDRKDEDSIWKAFKIMPWLAVPFNEMYCRMKLRRIFKFSDLGGLQPISMLVIIGPREEFIKPFGAQISNKYAVKSIPVQPLQCCQSSG